MRVLVRFPGDRVFLLMALLLHGILLFHFSTRTTVAAARVHVRETELQRSLARYRLLLGHDESRRDPMKSENLEMTSSEEKEQKEKETNTDNAGENPEPKVDELQAGVQLVGEEDDKTKIKQSDNVELETAEQHIGNQQSQPDNPKEANDKQRQKKNTAGDKEQRDPVGIMAEEPNLRNENQDEVIQQQIIAEEVKSDEKIQEEARKLDNLAKTAAKEGLHSAHSEGQKESIEEQKQVESRKTESQSETKAEIQQQGEVREEPQSGHENSQQDEVREEPEVKANEQQTESEEEEVVSKTKEKMTEEKWESESKSEEEKTAGEREDQSEFNKTEGEKPADEEPFVFPEPYLLGPTIKDWDEQRGNWLNSNPHMKTTSDGKPRVLIVSGSQPNPCRSPEGDHFNLKSLKVKVDYARMHNYEIFYNFAWLDPLFGSYWVKLPILRKLMITHPETEWFFWIDSDAVFTDMLFEAPFQTYKSEGMNMVMWGYHEGFYVEKSWVSFNAGVFIIRNCQWSLDLIDKWSPMGPDGPVRDEYGKMLTSYLSYRMENYPADDQSALAYLILTDEAVKSKVKLVELTDYMMSAWWVEVVDNYETSMEKYHPGLGDSRWPWITHFTGCGPCGGDGSSPDYQKCMKSIERALNFADNQVLAYMGFQHESLSSEALIRIRNESDKPLEFVGVNPWKDRIAQVTAAAAA